MKSITVLFKNIVNKIKKRFERHKFLNSLPSESLKDMEIRLHKKLYNLNYSIKELLDMKYYELLRSLQNKKNVENLFVSLQEEIKKRDLDIDLKKYPAFKDFELKNEDKLNYLNESFKERQQTFTVGK